jgi:hypothetical protein
MVDCSLCFVPAIVAKETTAYILNDGVNTKTLYKSYIPVTKQEISKGDFRVNFKFTPGFRLNYDYELANEALRHKEAWSKFLKEENPYAIVFDDAENADDTQLSIYLENLQPPKDWDILIFTPTQYILNKRAAKILYYSANQFNKPIKDYITSFFILKTIKVI